MKARHTSRNQFTALRNAPFNAELLCILIRTAFLCLLYEGFVKVAM